MTQYTSQSQPQLIYIGATANDGTGDDIRAGAIKSNTNFTDLYNAVNSIPTYVLPSATTTTLGGVRVDGTSITATNGVISATVLSGANALPIIDGVATIGVSDRYARQDHVHPISIPSGIIVMWSGAINAVPSGWKLCDGTNGTPNLRDKFIVGAGTTYSVGNTGGSADAVVVSHSHTATSTFTGSPLGSHTHSITDPTHYHLMPGDDQLKYANGSLWSNIYDGTFGYDAGSQPAGGGKIYRTSASATGISINSASAGTPSGSVSTSVTSAGNSATNANLPPYYALAYIMKS